MYFGTKNYLKSNRYHTVKHPLKSRGHGLGFFFHLSWFFVLNYFANSIDANLGFWFFPGCQCVAKMGFKGFGITTYLDQNKDHLLNGEALHSSYSSYK